MTVTTYRFNEETGEMEVVAKREGGLRSRAPAIHAPFEPFRSPVDGSVIKNPRQLAEHNRRNGVSNDPDSLKEQTRRHQKRMEKPYVGDKKEHINDLVKAYDVLQHNPQLLSRQE